MEDILPETLKIVFSYLDPLTAFRTVPKVCKKWNRVVNEKVYHEIYLANFGETLADTENKIVSALSVTGKWKQVLIKAITKVLSFKDNEPATIYWAASEGHHQYVKRTLAHSAVKWHLYFVGNDQLSALHTCAIKQDVKMVQILCDHVKHVLQFPIDAIVARYGRTPLHAATYVGAKNVVECLLYYGANMNKRESLYGQNCIHIASSRGWVEIVSLYLDHGMQINTQDNDNMTPLYLASLQGHISVVKELLRRGADPAIASNGGTAADVARVKRYTEIFDLLQQAVQTRNSQNVMNTEK